jgi:UDPglucose 6-dehydrogenase
MANKSIACCGAGFVGGNLSQVFTEKGLTVFSYDVSGKKPLGAEWPETECGVEFLSRSIADFVNACESHSNFAKIYFVCLPTPMYEDGSADLSIVEGALSELASVEGNRIAVVKSTVPPGSTEKWNKKFNAQGLYTVHSPEFLREMTALDDTRNQDRIILGGPLPWVNEVRDIFRMAFPTVPIYKTSSTNSEMTKYVINTFLATKVSFANEIWEICQKMFVQGDNVDYDRIIELATLDKRLGTSHWQVPGPMPSDDEKHELRRGYAGSCFIKDINALISYAKSVGVDPMLLEASWHKNECVRPERDWENLLGRAISKKK